MPYVGTDVKVVLVTQSCPTPCDSMDCSWPGTSVLEILQVRILEWVAFPSPGDLRDPGIERGSLILQADSLWSEHQAILLLVTVANFLL